MTGLSVEVKAVQAEEAPNVFTDATFIYTVSGEDIPPADVERAIDLSLTRSTALRASCSSAGMNVATEYHIVETA